MKLICKKIYKFIKAETVLCVSGAAALLTMFFVHPSKAYLAYLDDRVLALLFCLMAVVAGFNETGIFLTLSEKLLKKVVGIRSLSLALVMLCFLSSMWVTNDVALITFVPFAIMVLSIAGQSKYILRIIVLQTIAANLGSMLTPVGNPQNLFLYNYYNVPILEFLKITAPFAVVSLVLLLFTVFMIKKEPLSFEVPDNKTNTKNKYHLTVYSGLFLVCLACVLRLLDSHITLVIVLSVILVFNRMLLKKVDYALLLTFVFFFIFVGNMGNIPAVKDFLAELIAERELAVAIGASQLISNVPAAVLLSAFTDDYKALILGTDIGGLGTLVASLASLISYKFYCKAPGANPRRYLGIFTGYNLAFLAGLILFYMLKKYVGIS